MSEIGHNNPPEVIDLASGVISSISEFMSEWPVVEDEEDARRMKLQVDRAKACIKDLEAERDTKVRPLNEQVSDINGKYRQPRRLLGSLLDEMLARIEDFVFAERERREKIAAEAEAKAREAERLALEAERIEREKLDDASKGEVGVNVAEVIADADQAFEEYEKAERQAILAKREMHVKVGGGFSRAIGLRSKETLHVEQPFVAIMMLGITPDIREAILKAARAWRKVHGTLPDGVVSTTEERL